MMNEAEDSNIQAIKGLKGLQNLGNTCYINATLQALLHIRSLRLYFTETYFRRLRLQWDNSIDSLFHQFMTSMWTIQSSNYDNHNNNRSLFNSKNQSSKHQQQNFAQDSLIILRALVSFIWKRYTFFSPGDQHDSQEFLQCFLHDLHESLKTPRFYPAELSNCNKLNNYNSKLKKLAKFLIEYDQFDDDNDNNDNVNDDDTHTDYYNKIDQFIKLTNIMNNNDKQKSITINNYNNNNDIDDDDDLPILFDSLLLNNPSNNNNNNKDNDENVKYRSIITDLFAGELENTIRCTSCGHQSILNETFLNLSIPITAIDRAIQSKIQNSMVFPIRLAFNNNNQPDNTTTTITNQRSLIERSMNYTIAAVRYYYDYLCNWFDWFMSFISSPSVDLRDCLETFFNPELLEKENRYNCDNCKKLCNGIKCIRIKRLPEILIVHLNRYQNVNSVVRKITSQLNFPLNDFSLKSFLSESVNASDVDTEYDLVAIVCHNGTQVTNGHYICYALNEVNFDWYEFDDIHVSYVDKDRILSMASSAYILFYQRNDQHSMTTRAINVICDLERRWIQTNTDDAYLKRINLNIQDYYFFSNASTFINHQSSPSLFSYKVNLDDAFINLKSYHISKRWLMAFQSIQNPGPIDNSNIYCAHGLIRPTEYLFFNNLSLPVIEPVGQFLWLLYGGGPLFQQNINYECRSEQQQYAVCLECSLSLDQYDDRRKYEFNEFVRLQSLNVHMFRKLKLKSSKLIVSFDNKRNDIVDNVVDVCNNDEDLLIISNNNDQNDSDNDNGAIITTVDDDDDNNNDDDNDNIDDDKNKSSSINNRQMTMIDRLMTDNDEQSVYYYLISAEWIIQWLSFVNVRFDQSTVTARDRQLFSLYDQIYKKHEERQQNEQQPFDQQYRRMIHLRTKTIHPPLASLLRSMMNTMNKNQFQIDAEHMLKQIDLNLHTVLPPNSIDNWSIFGLKRKILTENNDRINMNKKIENKHQQHEKYKTIDMAKNYDDICGLFAEILSGQSIFDSNATTTTNDDHDNDGDDEDDDDSDDAINYNENDNDDNDDDMKSESNQNNTLSCQYKFAFHSRYGGLYEENSCCVFYLVSSDYWKLFSRIYGGGPAIRFNYLLNKFEANITVDDVEFFMRKHYRQQQQQIVHNNNESKSNKQPQLRQRRRRQRQSPSVECSNNDYDKID